MLQSISSTVLQTQGSCSSPSLFETLSYFKIAKIFQFNALIPWTDSDENEVIKHKAVP